MAIYHCTTRPIARGAGRSAVAAAAYRASEELVDQRTGQVHDYTRRYGVVSAEILLPDGGSADRSQLWNAAEAAEKRKDSRVAREWILALPAELNDLARADLARAFAGELVQRYGVAVDVAIHEPDQEGDQRNYHAHLMTTTRQVSRGVDGLELGAKTAIELGDKDRAKIGIEGRSSHDIEQLRERWANLANDALERAGRSERIDHRSLAAQGIDREATTHLGPVATDMERRGRASDRGDGNRQVVMNNAQREQVKAQIIDLAAERERRQEHWNKKTAAEIRQEIERYKRKQGPLPFWPAEQVADSSDKVTRVRTKLVEVTKRRAELHTQQQRAEQEAKEWAKKHPMRARMAALGLARVEYLAEREQISKAVREELAATAGQVEQAEATYKQTLSDMLDQVEQRYRPQREWVRRAEKLAEKRDQEERLSASREIQRGIEERYPDRSRDPYRDR